MRPVRVCVAVLAAALGGWSWQKPNETKADEPPVDVYADAEAYKVYAAALAIDSWYWEGSNTILILREIPPREWALRAPTDVLRGGAAFAREMQPLFKSFSEANKEPKLLNTEVDLHRAHRFVRNAELDEAFRKGEEEKNHDVWQGFREAFPNAAGYLMLSAVGFNPSKTMALVYVEHRCGNRCGGAYYYVLQKLGGVWVKYFPPDEPTTSKL
jgi:hypothetical protein